MEHLRKPRHPLAYRMIERILSVMAALGLACLCIGLVLFIAGNASGHVAVARIGAYVLVIGVALVVLRLFYWIAVEITERG